MFLPNLNTRLAAAGYTFSNEIQQKLADYLTLLEQWNKTYNLTSVRNPEEMIIKHILDSLAITPFLQRDKILDVGSGAGLPGIPLALTQPDRQFFLLDSNNKKIQFLSHVITTLKISNAQTIYERVEKYSPTECFTTITSRAFSTLADFTVKTQHLICHNGLWLAMKGQYPTDEIKEIDEKLFNIAVHPLTIPGLDAERHVVCLKL